MCATPQYSVKLVKDECTFNSDFVETAVCHTNYLNATVANETVEIQLKPMVKINNLFVSNLSKYRKKNWNEIRSHVSSIL